jgi:peptide/nickel transport system substrate-binding protein
MLLIPTYYELVPFNNYTFGEPYIARLVINFYRDESSLISAYNGGAIEAMNSISPDNIPTIKKQPGAQVQTSPLSRVYAVFFNQNQSAVLGYPEVRQALNLATNRTEIVNKVLDGHGEPIVGPIPAGMIGGSTSTDIYNINQAQAILAKAGWVKSTTTGYLTKSLGKKQTVELDVTISTLNSPDLVEAAQLIQADFDFGDLQQNVIRTRKFDALLYGTVIGRDMDFFSFWDSSQRNDPGLNISMYANSKADKLLEDARTTSDPSTRMQDYLAFQNIVEQDVPAVFLYSPDFIYVTTQDVKELHINTITMPYERFLDINSWYIETNNLWKMFLPKSQQ